MSRSRRTRRSRARPSRSTPTRRPPKPKPARTAPRRAARPPKTATSPSRTTEAETRLLGLAAAIAPLAAPEAMRLLAVAYAPDAPLPRAVTQAWLRSRGDKTATLALAFARENLRLALEDVLARAPRGALPGSPALRAWLLLAACEAIALEPPEAALDRVRTLLELSGSV
jgi:hypothetical protein